MLYEAINAPAPILQSPASVAPGDLRPGDAMPATSGQFQSMRALSADPTIVVLRGTLLSLVRRDGRDLTVRQLSAFLAVYMDDAVHTASSLAEAMCVARAAVTRILDRLAEFDLIAREEHQEDRRRVLVRRTTRGLAFFRELTGYCHTAAAEQEQAAA